jgi:hypothetical protein
MSAAASAPFDTHWALSSTRETVGAMESAHPQVERVPEREARERRAAPSRAPQGSRGAAAGEEVGEVRRERARSRTEDALFGRVEELEPRVRAHAQEAPEQREQLSVDRVAVERRRRGLDLQEVRELRKLRQNKRRLARHAAQKRCHADATLFMSNAPAVAGGHAEHGQLAPARGRRERRLRGGGEEAREVERVAPDLPRRHNGRRLSVVEAGERPRGKRAPRAARPRSGRRCSRRCHP